MMQTIRLTMAQALVRFLDQQYVERDGQESKFFHGIMGIFGHGNVTGIGQALETYEGQLPYIQGHNEQGMVHAATAFAKQKQRLATYACTSSIGPGALNMITAAATATVNRIPVLLLPGDVFACRQPDPVLQQLEMPWDYTLSANDAFKPVSKFWDRISRPEQLLTAALQAMRVLTDPVETGAVTLALPQDVQTEAYAYPEVFFHKRVHVIERHVPDARALAKVIDAITHSRRPLIIAGGGVHYAQATTALADLARTCGIPVAQTQAGKSALLSSHPLCVGGVGVTGTRAANRLAHGADLIIAVGTRLSDFTTASKSAFDLQAQIVHINVSRQDALKMDAVPLVADARVALVAVQEALVARGYAAPENWTGYVGQLKAQWNVEVDRLYADDRPTGLTQTAALGVINREVRTNGIVVAAAGGLPGDLHRLWRSQAIGSYHMEYGFSCMGYEVAGAFGVKLAEPGREVYALVGDGSYLMLHSELVTSLQEGRKITILLFDNSGFQCIHNLQRAQGSDGFGNELRYRAPESGRLTGEPLAIDFCAHAQSLGARGYRAQTLDQLETALQLARQETVSTLIDIKVLPGTGTDGYDSWWRVGVAEVSDSERVQAAYADMHTRASGARPF